MSCFLWVELKLSLEGGGLVTPLAPLRLLTIGLEGMFQKYFKDI